MAHLSEKEREMYTNVFLSIDTDNNGWLSRAELLEGCRRLGFNISEEQAEASFAVIDVNSDGRITLDEFLAVMGHIEETNPRAKKEAKLRRIFRDMDQDGDGLLSEKELMDGLRDAGYSISREQTTKLCKELDKSGDGKLDFEEFIQMFDI